MEKKEFSSLEQQKEMAVKALNEIALVEKLALEKRVIDLKSLGFKLLEFNVINKFYDAKQGKAVKGPFANLYFKAVGAAAANNWGTEKVSFGTPEAGIDCYIAIAKGQLVLFYYEHTNR